MNFDIVNTACSSAWDYPVLDIGSRSLRNCCKTPHNKIPVTDLALGTDLFKKFIHFVGFTNKGSIAIIESAVDKIKIRANAVEIPQPAETRKGGEGREKERAASSEPSAELLAARAIRERCRSEISHKPPAQTVSDETENDHISMNSRI